jgi:TolA-binding protein
MSCERIVKDEFAEKYLLGQLNDAEQEAYEQHYFECHRCFDELQTYRALQNELQKLAPPEPAREPAWQGTGWWWGWRWAAATAAAAVVLAIGINVWLGPSETPAPAPPIAAVPAPPSSTAPGTPAEPTGAPVPAVSPSLAELAQVVPPVYTPIILRGAPDEATQQFRAAMDHYAKGDYHAAIPGLRAAARLKPDAAHMGFYLGGCYLLAGDTHAAVSELRRTIALGDTPYLEDAHFFLAKAYLRQGDSNAAQRELRATIQLQGEHEQEARELLQRIETLSQAPR